MILSIYEEVVSLEVYNQEDVLITDLSMKNCAIIRVLDEKKKIFEIAHIDSTNKCIVSPLGERIIIYEE